MLTDEPTASLITDAVQVSTATTPGAEPAPQMLLTNTQLTEVGYVLGKLDEGSYEDFMTRARILAKEQGLTTFLLVINQVFRGGRSAPVPLVDVPVKVESIEQWERLCSGWVVKATVGEPMVFVVDAARFDAWPAPNPPESATKA